MKTIFIAELGSNHNQNYHRAIDLIDSAKACGFDKVKFQLYSKDTLYAPGYTPENLIEFPVEWIPGLYKHCLSKEIEIGYSIFHESFIEKAVNYCHFLKISSWDILRYGLIEKCLNTKLPVMISLGGVSNDEFKDLYDKVLHYYDDNQITLFHCIPKYPTQPHECNLETIRTLRDLIRGCIIKYGILRNDLVYTGPHSYKIGWSDHTARYPIIHMAIAKGAEVIEMHFDLDDLKGNESHHGHVWSTLQSKVMIKQVREMEQSIINGWLDCNNILFKKERLQRADPEDGLRPMRIMRNDKTGTDKEEV